MEIGPAVPFQDGSGSGPLPAGAESQLPGSPAFQPRKPLSKEFLCLAVALVAAAVIVYAPVRQFGFHGFDDIQYVSGNPRVLQGVTWDGVKWAFTTGYFSNWHPLTWISHMLDAQIFGTNAAGHHVANLLFHIANTLLLFGLLHRMTGRIGRSAFVAALFAVHPLHVESVVWVSERKDVLSTLFGLLAIWGYLWYARRPQHGRYLVVVLLFAMGLMAKAMILTLPFVLLLLDVWPLGRVRFPADSSGRLTWASLRDHRTVLARLVWEKLPLFVLAAASSVATLVAQHRWGAVANLDAMPLDFRLANAVVSYVAYIANMLWPVRLSIFYPYPDSLPGWQVFGSMLILIAVSAAAIRAARRKPYLAVGWLWYVGTLVPVIGLVQVGNQAMADRYTYVPLIGLFLMFGWGIPDLLERWPLRKIALPAAAGVVICACMVTARGQVQYWESDLSLWTRALEVTTRNHVAHNNLGTALASQGKVHEALAHYAESLRINPDNENAHYNIGVALDRQGRVADALAHYAEVLRLNPGNAEAHNNIGALFHQQGRIGEAVRHYREAVRRKPDYVHARQNLGNALASQGQVTEAIAHYTAALAISPTNETIRTALEVLTDRP